MRKIFSFKITVHENLRECVTYFHESLLTAFKKFLMKKGYFKDTC